MVHPNRNKNQFCGPVSHVQLSVPGKAMLFGEYGVLRGGATVVVLLSSFRKTLSFELRESPENSQGSVSFDSDLFAEPVHLHIHDASELMASEDESERRNLACYVSGFADYLANKTLSVRVCESFSSALGFGSSSAILVAFQHALSQFKDGSEHSFRCSSEEFWTRLYHSLIQLQKRGSGYDVATQAWFLSQSKTSSYPIVCFQNSHWQSSGFKPNVNELVVVPEEHEKLGCFVGTGVRSDTRRVLQAEKRKVLPDEFYQFQMTAASLFAEKPFLATALDLCKEAAVWARRLEMLPASQDVETFLRVCDEEKISWKTMGAGHGDCLWVLAPRRQIEDILVRRGLSTLSISHAFAEGV